MERYFRFYCGNREQTIPLHVIKEMAELDPAAKLNFDDEQELLRWYCLHVFLEAGWEEL
jgi:hypothetical protein